MPAPKPRKRNDARRWRLQLDLQFGRGDRIEPLNRQRVIRVVNACLESDFAITIRFATQHEAAQLNRRFRQRRYVPNVLTFSYLPLAQADIVICTAVVRRQAREQSKTYADHLTHLIVHGVLHAQGYSHDRPATTRRMEARERHILAGFGIGDPYLSPVDDPD